jgi:transposase
MSKPTYPAKYRERLVDLVRAGRSPENLAEEFEPCAATIRAWVKQADLDQGRRQDGLTSEERAEIQRLKRENRQLREEREILKKAAAWFAKEADGAPSKRSDS